MMRAIFVGVLATVLTGCVSPQQVVTAGQLMPQQKTFTTAAIVPQDGNSAAMSSQIQQQLSTYGITSKPQLPIGTRQSNDVDLIVTYSDKWFWDLTMYLMTITVNFYDGATGNLLVTGRWENSRPHGSPRSQDVIKNLLDEMHGKLGNSSPTATINPTQSSSTAVPYSGSVPTTSNKPSATDRLKELDSMHKQGLITDSEYANKKQEILKSM